MLEALKADLAAIAKKMEETATSLQVMFGQKQGIEHSIAKIEAAAPEVLAAIKAADPAAAPVLDAVVPAVEADIAKVEAVADAAAPTEPVSH